MEWKKVQFKADQKDKKNLILRRMTGPIEDVMREVPATPPLVDYNLGHVESPRLRFHFRREPRRPGASPSASPSVGPPRLATKV